MNEPIYVSDYLYRNGIVIERARREGRSLSAVERNIIVAGRWLAEKKGLDRHRINSIEMEGERDKDQVFAPIKVVAVFAYWTDPCGEFPPEVCYYLRESNHPGLPVYGNVDEQALKDAGIKLPKTPTYLKWVKAGKKVTRS